MGKHHAYGHVRRMAIVGAVLHALPVGLLTPHFSLLESMSLGSHRSLFQFLNRTHDFVRHNTRIEGELHFSSSKTVDPYRIARMFSGKNYFEIVRAGGTFKRAKHARPRGGSAFSHPLSLRLFAKQILVPE